MADTFIETNPGTGGAKVAVDSIEQSDGSVFDTELVKIQLGEIGANRGPVHVGNPLPTRDALVEMLVEQNEQVLQMLEHIHEALVDVAEAAGGVQRCRKSETSSVASSITAVPLAIANTARSGLIIVNSSTATLYVKYGEGATSGSGIPLLPGDYWEMQKPCDTGQVSGIWSAANGTAIVIESSRVLTSR